MEDEKLIAFYQRAFRFSHCKLHRQEDREDFASFALIQYMKRGSYSLPWIWVDFVRSRFGKKGTKSSVHRKAEFEANPNFPSFNPRHGLPDTLEAWADLIDGFRAGEIEPQDS